MEWAIAPQRPQPPPSPPLPPRAQPAITPRLEPRLPAPQPPRSYAAAQHQPVAGPSRSASSSENVICACGENAVERTVTKENENKGRLFYVCYKGRDEGCSFFQWADQPATSAGPPHAVPSKRSYSERAVSVPMSPFLPQCL